MKPLPKGKYKVAPKEKTFIETILNGHRFIGRNTTAISDGEWVTFYDGKKKVWDCNANYAAANFKFEET